MRNYYEVLNVPKDATPEQIKKSFLALVTKYHPDVYTGDKDYAEQFTSELTEAYSVLKDEQKRHDYDIENRVNTYDTIYQSYSGANQAEDSGSRVNYGRNYEQESSRKYFKNTKIKSEHRSFFKKVFTSKLFYSLLFVFAIEALIIYLVYISA